MSNKEIARGLVAASGLVLIAVSLFHFFGTYAVVGLFGAVLRYRHV